MKGITKSKEVGEKQKDKTPEFPFKKAMIDQSNEINSKIKELTQSMNKMLVQEKEDE